MKLRKLPPSPGCEQCACPHNETVSEWVFEDTYWTHTCMRCGHTWIERKQVEW